VVDVRGGRLWLAAAHAEVLGHRRAILNGW